VEAVASLSQGGTAAAQCGLFTHKSYLNHLVLLFVDLGEVYERTVDTRDELLP